MMEGGFNLDNFILFLIIFVPLVIFFMILKKGARISWTTENNCVSSNLTFDNGLLVFILSIIYIVIILLYLNAFNIQSMCFIFIIYILPVSIIILSRRRAKIKVNKESINKEEFNNNKYYYRSIINTYSAPVISFLQSFDTDKERDISSILLTLELKKVIKINSNNIEILNDKVKLNWCEEYVLNKIKDNTLKEITNEDLKIEIIYECLDKDLIIKYKNKYYIKNKKINNIIDKIQLFITAIGILLLLSSGIIIKYLNNTYKYIFIILLIVIMIDRFVRFYKYLYKENYIEFKNKSYIHTDKGKYINIKMIGLKNFLKDFSNMKDTNKEELMLWEYFLIYSVVFDINKEIINRMKKYI